MVRLGWARDIPPPSSLGNGAGKKDKRVKGRCWLATFWARPPSEKLRTLPLHTDLGLDPHIRTLDLGRLPRSPGLFWSLTVKAWAHRLPPTAGAGAW